MGNSFSTNDVSALRDMVQRPGQVEAQMNKSEIEGALKAAADILNKKKLNISIVTVGGAVNTLLLHSRPTTGDVDFFYTTKTKNADVSAIIEAATQVAKGRKGMTPGWLNNHTAVFMTEGDIAKLYQEAVQQNEVVFQAPGLKVYAAPWRYALATKLDRLSKPNPKPYDIDDAAAYLKKLVTKRGSPVKKQELKDWCKEFKFMIPSDVTLGNLQKKATGQLV